MKKKFLLISALIVACGIVNNSLVYSSANGAQGPYTGYGGLSCAYSGCHSDYTLNSGSGTMAIKLMSNGSEVSSYTPGKTYQITTTLSYQGAMRIGFASEVLNSSHVGIGTSSTGGSSSLQKVTFVTGRPYMTHTYAGCNSMQNSGTYTYNWIAPVKGTGTVTIYSATNAANGDGNTGGDHIYTKTLAISESTSSIETQNSLGVSLNIYPNPSSGQLNVTYTLPAASRVNVQLWSIDGKLIKTLADAEQAAGNNTLHANISDVATGTYLLKISAGENTSVQRIVKN